MPPVTSIPGVLRRAAAVLAALALATGGLTAATLPAHAADAADAAALALPAESTVRVNQLGYLPDGPKRATVVSSAAGPLPWQLRNASGAVVASGSTAVRGADRASGQSVHLADFSTYTGTGSGFTLTAGDRTSHPFGISAALYDGLRADSMSFFYQQRSGIPIDAALAGSAYTRPAGHLGVAPNKGDTSVPCQAGVCDYRLDVRGGWYDAGDHGKYVVNGGISVWEVVNSYERARRSGGEAALGDSTLRLPERGNGVPDVLDEARWELEFLLRMQVPEGRPLAGMAFHKMHDDKWTAVPTRPELDDAQRELHRPSTAATLNLAAAAAQCARVYAPHDAAFAARCLDASRRAFAAAKANPNLLAPASDNVGGGAYDDAGGVSDEFYWAAAELFATTGEAQYREAVTSSPQHSGPADGFWWGGTATLGRITLATVPGVALPADDLARLRSALTTAADGHLSTMAGQGYAVPLPATGYGWGSNSAVANNAMVLAVAYELTGQQRYRAGALESLDYLLGRNALDLSYVTGYGERHAQNQHHRFWAHQNDASLPHPPAGSFAGGPNAGLEDPVAKEKLSGCAPAACYVDDIGSYSTNEVAINWNASLAWLTAFAAERRSDPATPAVQVAPAVTVPEGGTAQVGVRLSDAPAQNVTVTVARSSGDQDLTVTAGATLVFTPANWASAQQVSVSAAQDSDAAAGSATFTVGGTGVREAVFTATESDDDTAPPTASCAVDYRVENSWGNGFTATVTVKNTGTSAVSGWTLAWNFAGDQQIGNAWNAAVSQSGTGVTAKDLGWNGTLAPGGSVSFGFQATYSGANSAPARYTLNGASCS
ncbi:glycoside hydrolase family 9 protein [Streptomyces sp. TRM66268-LWL]|uniref:Endoglucanase n=1 Tax=Streptomyces polyasparticus TaxID=2767826 RepID=A0ABR7SFS5_9ACTN|nr:glycoside hydrolase family 9 protein [Streptomyces polyasparticus]MBC9713158.1 glycoside hydrolase family 9 protein [Streptomyces polyasparticus]